MALLDYFGEDSGTLTDGQRKISAVAATTVGREVPQWVKKMSINVSADIAPICAMLNRKKGGVKTIPNYRYNHLEDDFPNRWVEIDSFTTDGDGTSFVLTTGQGVRIQAGSMLHVPRTGEALRVASVSTDTMVVTRGFGSSTAVTLLTSEDIEIGASVYAEGTGAPDSKTWEPTILTNYMQTTKEAVELSGRLLNMQLIDGGELEKQLKKAQQAIRHGQETSLLHGARNTSDPTATGGLDYYLSTNLTNAGGALTEATINTFAKSVLRRNKTAGNSLVLFAGELLLDAFDTHARDSIRYRPDDKILGVSVKRLRNSHGEIGIVPHGLLTVNPTMAGTGYLVNLDKIKMVEFKGRGFNYKPNVETPGTDGRKDQFVADWGVWLATEKSHGKIYGVTG